MKNKVDELGSESRRSVLQYAAIAGGGLFFSGTAAANGSSGTGNADPSTGDVVQLGDFESDLDGWKTDGGNKLTRVTDEQFPAGIASGEHALGVDVRGDLFPAIRKKKDLKGIDFSNHPYLRTHVVALAEDTDSDLLFQFRLHHRPTKGTKKDSSTKNEKKDDGPSRGKSKNLVKSEFERVPQITPREIQWDLSDLSDEILQSVERVEIGWQLADHRPEGGPRGRTKGEFDYQGMVLFDDVRLLESNPETPETQQVNKKRALHREHGMIVDRKFETRTADLERGTLVFSDGTEVPYEFEILDSGGYRYTIDGETFESSGGDGDE